MEDIDILNIPAYQRKRSIMAKAKRNQKKAIDEIRKLKTKGKRKAPKRTPRKYTSSRLTQDAYSRPTNSVTIEDALGEIPLYSDTVASAPVSDLFSPPITSSPSSKSFREMHICGQCEGYFDNIEVAIIKLTKPLRVGDKIIFEDMDGLFEQEVKSMQIDRQDVNLAHTGSDIGLKVLKKPKVGTHVYKVIDQ